MLQLNWFSHTAFVAGLRAIKASQMFTATSFMNLAGWFLDHSPIPETLQQMLRKKVHNIKDDIMNTIEHQCPSHIITNCGTA